MRKELILSGKGNGVGVYEGIARIVRSTNDNVSYNDVLITKTGRAEYFSQLTNCAAIITDQGGSLCHLSICALEMGKPGVFGTQEATKTLSDGDWVLVDSDEGKVYKLSQV